MTDLIGLLLRIAKQHSKRVATLAEITRLSSGSPAAVGMALRRAKAKGIVDHVGTIWINLLDPPDLETVALAMPMVSYVSFESALYSAGVLSQSPRGEITLATTGRPKTFSCTLGTIRFIHMKHELFFGFDGRRHAYPEKAWLDLLYRVFRFYCG